MKLTIFYVKNNKQNYDNYWSTQFKGPYMTLSQWRETVDEINKKVGTIDWSVLSSITFLKDL